MTRRRLPKHVRLPARLQLGKAIATARRTAGLTQEKLGQRLGLKGRAIYRWECNDTAPSQRHRRALIQEIHLLNPQAGLELQAAISLRTGKEYKVIGQTSDASQKTEACVAETSLGKGGAFVATSGQPGVRKAVFTGTDALEFAILKMADELDVAPRRARRALSRLFERLVDTNLGFESLRTEIARAVAQD